ncbi:MAG: hypothetical protein Q8880_00745 [Bacteroidota bacterium]|nr:hypothetical protein [Bacteroidota bacterium]
MNLIIKNKFNLILIFFISAILFNSCKNDVNLIAPNSREIPVVYGLLEANKSTQYIRINKAFLTTSNTLTVAKDMSASNYVTDEIDVFIDSNDGKSIKLIRDTIHNKISGTFYSPDEIVYRADNFKPVDKQYTLRIVNKKSGNVFTANTNVISKFDIDNLLVIQKVFGLEGSYAHNIKWFSSPYGRLYEVKLRFYYYETNIITNVITRDSIDMSCGKVRSDNLTGGDEMSIGIYGTDFFKFLANNIKVNHDVKRSSPSLKFIFMVGTDDLNTYMMLNEPSNSIVQERPSFSNISNGGIGIFSSRYIYELKEKDFNSATLDSIKIGYYTKNLNFQ